MFKHFFCEGELLRCEGELLRKAGALLVSVRRDSQCLSSHNSCAVYKTRSVSLRFLPAFSLGSCTYCGNAAGYFIFIVTVPYAIMVI